VYRSDRDCCTKLRGGEALIAVSGVKRRRDLECFEPYVWVKIAVTDGRNLHVGNHHLSSDVQADINKNISTF
jgi:hypothetical protein